MRVLAASINPQVGHLLARQTVTGQHALYRFGDSTLRVGAFEDFTCSAVLDAAGMTGVPIVCFIGAFFASQLDFIRIDDDDIVTHIHMRGKAWLVLATKEHRDNRGQTAKNDAFSVNQDPFLVDVCRCRRKSFNFAST